MTPEQAAEPRLWWVSWEQPGDDYRALTWPPTPPEVLAYWCTGGDADGTFSTVVALVRAIDDAAVWAAIRHPDAWPDAGEERFCDVYKVPEISPYERFPAPSPGSAMFARWPWPRVSKENA